MAARVSFLTSTIDPATLDMPPRLTVPAGAVVQRNGRDVVFVVDEGEVRMTPVALGAAGADGRELVTKLPRAPRSCSIRRPISATARRSRRTSDERDNQRDRERDRERALPRHRDHPDDRQAVRDRQDVLPRQRADPGARRPRPRRAQRLVRGADGAVGLRQVDAAQHHRRPRPAEQRERPGRRRRSDPDVGQPARQVAVADHRLRVPVVQPDPGADRGGERRAAAAA
jgi:hypothetical protein